MLTGDAVVVKESVKAKDPLPNPQLPPPEENRDTEVGETEKETGKPPPPIIPDFDEGELGDWADEVDEKEKRSEKQANRKTEKGEQDEKGNESQTQEGVC